MIRKFILSATVSFAMTATCLGQGSTYRTSDQYLVPTRPSSARIVGDGQTGRMPVAPPRYTNPGQPNAAMYSPYARQQQQQQQAAGPMVAQPAPQNATQGAAGSIGCDSYRAAGGCDSRGGCDGAVGDCGPCNVGQNYFGQGCGDGCAAPVSDGCRYIKILGGWNGLQDMVYLGPAAPFRTTFSEGWMIGAALGKQIDCNLRREFEFTYRNNSGDEFLTNPVGAGPVAFPLDGSVQAYAGMTNFFYNFGCIGGFQPYIGGGVGGANINGDVTWNASTLSYDDWVFAYQAMAGLERQLGSRAKAFVEYRYFATDDVEADLSVAGVAAGTFEDEYLAENVIFGVSFTR